MVNIQEISGNNKRIYCQLTIGHYILFVTLLLFISMLLLFDQQRTHYNIVLLSVMKMTPWKAYKTGFILSHRHSSRDLQSLISNDVWMPLLSHPSSLISAIIEMRVSSWIEFLPWWGKMYLTLFVHDLCWPLVMGFM